MESGNTRYIRRNFSSSLVVKYRIESIGKMKIGSNWVDCVTYSNLIEKEDNLYTITKEEFEESFIKEELNWFGWILREKWNLLFTIFLLVYTSFGWSKWSKLLTEKDKVVLQIANKPL